MWPFHFLDWLVSLKVFSFQLILIGVYKRGLLGNSSQSDTKYFLEVTKLLSQRAWEIVKEGMENEKIEDGISFQPSKRCLM
jgi:hypothetical protein